MQLGFQLDQELVDHAQDVIHPERLELNHGIQAVAELRTETLADHFHCIGAVVLLGETDRAPRSQRRTGIGRHHHNHVLEVRLAPIGVGEHAAVHHLQQDVEDVRMRLLDFIQQ